MFFYRISSAFSAWSLRGAIERYHLYIFHEAAYLSMRLRAILQKLSLAPIMFKTGLLPRDIAHRTRPAACAKRSS